MSALTTKKQMFCTISLLAVSLVYAPLSQAQITISDEQTAPQETNGQDLTIDSNGSVNITTAGPAVTLNSDNALLNSGAITIADVDNATAVNLEGGAGRSFTNSGSISVTEDYTPTDTDDDPFVDGPFAQGTGRTGILISGASPFVGNIEMTSTSTIDIEGNDSFGINLTNTSMAQDGLTGNLTNGGRINVRGTNATGINIASGITGDFANTGPITTLGQGAQAINIAADIQGGFVNAGGATNSGYRFTTRPGLSNETTGASGRDQLGAEDLLQAGSALNISGNITGGVLLEDRFADVLDADGNQTFDDDGNVVRQRVSTSNIVQNGSAPAILIDGGGTPIAIGLVAEITDSTNADFDADLQYAFVNQGAVTANGVYDDVDTTVFQVANTTLTGGFRNTGTLSANSFVTPSEAEAILLPGSGHARVIVFGSAAIADEINNSGVILASSSEAADAIYADRDNIPAARPVLATAIDIDSAAVVNSIQNSGGISAILVGRTGEAIAIIDRSGTLNSLSNTGSIGALARSSDPLNEADTNFSLVAIDVTANSTGFTLTQQSSSDTVTPSIFGDIRLGTGNDNVTISAGTLNGDIAFNSGNDTFALSGGSSFNGVISNLAGLDIDVTDGSSLGLSNTSTVSVTSANFDATSTYAPTLDGSAVNTTATLVAVDNGGAARANGLNPGDITFETGATIAPILSNIVGITNTTFAIARAENTLTVGDLNSLTAENTPFLYNTNYAIDPSDPNTLLVTLDLRDASTAIADGGLGLDPVQAAAFGSAFTALTANSELGDAFANITDGTAFNQAYNQILPEFAAAARQFVFANVDGATGAVGNHLEAARRSPDKPGGAWLQEFAYFADRDLAGLSEQYRGAGFGFSGGLDTAFGPFHAVGVNVGFASTEIEDVVGIDEPMDVLTFQGGLYAGWESGNLGVEAYAGGGYSDFEQNRRVRINTFDGQSQGDWSGTHINGSVRAGYDMELNDKFWLRPTVSVDYLRLSEKAFSETGDAGIAISVDKRTSEGAGASAMFNFGAKFQGKRTWIRPSLRVGYRHEFINDPIMTNYRYIGLTGADGQTFNSADALLESAVFPDNGIILGFSVAAGSAYSSIGFDFDSDIRDGFIRHTGRVVVRLLF